MELNKIYNENCLDTMARMTDNFIDLTVTSPPYDNLRNYLGYTFDFESIAKELFRVTKQGGIVVWIVGDQTINGSESGTSFRQALYFKEIGFNLHDTMIYQKQNYLPTINKLMRYSAQFEYMFVLSKNKVTTFNPIQEKKVRNKIEKGCGGRQKNGTIIKTKLLIPKKNTKDATNIWSYPTERAKDAYNHPAIFPEKLVADHIHSWSNEGDLVYDCFGGSGTTGKIAHLLKRNWILSEISKEYCNIAEKRIKKYTNQINLF